MDRASVGIPYHYVLVGYYLATAVEQHGDAALGERLMQQVQQIARAAGLDQGRQG